MKNTTFLSLLGCSLLIFLSGCVGRGGLFGNSTTGNGTFGNNTTGFFFGNQPDEEAAAESEAESLKAGNPNLDWTYWRGPEFNGISRETGLPDDWDPEGGEGSNVTWRNEKLASRSTPVVMKGMLYTLCRSEPGTSREGEKVVCVDAATGEIIWEHAFNVYLSDVPDTRVGWSSVTADPETGYVYALGVCGLFHCLNGKTGEVIWAVPMHEQFGLLSTYGGRTNFPIIHEDLVIISAVIIGWGEMAKPAHRFIAFDKLNGNVVWFNGTRPLPYDTTYSAPGIAVINGQKALVFASGDGAVWAFQPRTGKPIWQYKFSQRGLNVPPLVVGDQVVASHSEENAFRPGAIPRMGGLALIDATGTGDVTETGEKWRLEEVMAGKSSPLVIDEKIYIFDDRAKLWIYDLKTGEQIGRKLALGTVMRSSPLYVDEKIYAITANGRWYILQPEEDGVKVINKGRLPKGEESHGSPICSQGRIYIPTTGALYCISSGEGMSGFSPRPESPEEAELTDETPAHIQVIPAEVLIRPSKVVTFRAKLYNAAGQFLGMAEDAKFSVEGESQISEDGTLLTMGDSHRALKVTATSGELTGTARVRVVPDLPWSFNFDGLSDPPVTWVGARYRHIIRDVAGDQKMVKITTIPKGTRSRCWFGHSDLNNYTIQADILGKMSNGKLPDIGVIAQGYALDLQGANQQLQIRSWVPQLRMASTVDFKWEPDTVYTMKFRAEIQGEKAILKGKVWPKDAEEPAEWTVEAEDSFPVKSGSPGLFGNAKDAELILDNISVTPNK